MLREQVWENDLWRLTTAVIGEVPGFSYLEPKRHVRYVHELDGPEAATFGAVLARTTGALKEAVGADLIYVYVFGGSFDHLHVHLAPYRQDGPLNDSIIKGEIVEQVLDNGAVIQTSAQFPPRPEREMRATVAKVRAALSS